MKRYDWAIRLGAFLYFLSSLLSIASLLVWDKFAPIPVDKKVIGITLSYAALLLFFSFWAYQLPKRPLTAKHRFAVVAGATCGVFAGIGGGMVFVFQGLPLLVVLIGVPEFWRRPSRNGDAHDKG